MLSFLLLVVSAYIAQAEVLGEIQRFPVKDARQAPFSSIGLINNFCSGSLIAPNKVLTAAHCAFDFENQAPMPVTEFHLGRNGLMQRGVTFPVLSASVHPLYPLTGDPHYDVAVLTIENFGISFPVLGVPESLDFSTWTLNFQTLTFEALGSIAGYPGDQLSGTMWFVACMFEQRISHINRPHYICDTFGGMSGSPLLQKIGEQTWVIGVHTNGGVKNSGLFLRPDILDFIRQSL